MNCLALILSLAICAYQTVTGAPTIETLVPTEDEVHKSSNQIDYLSRLMTMMGPFKESFMGCTEGTNVTNEDLLNHRRVNTLFNKEATDALKERFQIVRFRNGEFESINQRNVYLKYTRSLVTSDDAKFRGKDFLNGIYLHNTTMLKTQWTPQIAIFVGGNNLRFTDTDSSHCRIVYILYYFTFCRCIDFGSDEVPKGDGVLIPKMFGTYVDYFSITEESMSASTNVSMITTNRPLRILLDHQGITFEYKYISQLTDNPLWIISNANYMSQFFAQFTHGKLHFRIFSEPTSSFIIFRGEGIIYAHFYINYITDEHLKLKLREWKSTISFLKSHQIIAFQLRQSTVPESSEKIFNEVFGIWPISLHSIYGSGFTECSNVKSCNSTYGMTNFILVGFRELQDLKHSLHSDELKKQLEHTEPSKKKARYE